MRKELKKGDMEYDLFNDFWKIVKEYNIPENTDEYWVGLINAVNAYAKKYNYVFAHELVIAFLDSRDRIFHLKNALLCGK